MGREACANCHEEASSGHAATPHHHAFHEVDPATEPADGQFDHPPTRRAYRVYRESGKLRHREVLHVGGDEVLVLADHPVRYVVGSGHHARTYLVDAGGFLIESPATWYASRKEWALSPGYETNNTGFARPVYSECLFCHTGRVRANPGSRTQLDVVTQTIDCERCHGPGSLHVQRWESQPAEALSSGEPDLTIVHPGKLTRAENESICAQCHLHADAEATVRGRNINDFQPGSLLVDYRVQFARQSETTSMPVVGHVEQMHRSRCYQATDALTCTTCHDAHAKPSPETRLNYYRQQCLTCHQPEACGLESSLRLERSPQDDCISCHMPPTSTDVPHVAATHHRIGIHPEPPRDTSTSEVGRLAPFDDISHLPEEEQQRLLGLAYLNLSTKEGRPQVSEHYRGQAQQLLERVLQSGLDDPETLAALAQIYQRRNPQRSVELAQATLQTDALPPAVRTQALFALSDSCIALRRMDLAIQPLEELVRVRRQAGDWFLLGVCRYSAGNVTGALEAAKQAVVIRPEQSRFRTLLAELYERNGEKTQADEQRRWLQLLNPPREPEK